MARSMAEMSLETAGYQVIVSENGLDGLNAAREFHPDLILLDVMLPGVDGFTICKEIRKKSPIRVLS